MGVGRRSDARPSIPNTPQRPPRTDSQRSRFQASQPRYLPGKIYDVLGQQLFDEIPRLRNGENALAKLEIAGFIFAGNQRGSPERSRSIG